MATGVDLVVLICRSVLTDFVFQFATCFIHMLMLAETLSQGHIALAEVQVRLQDRLMGRLFAVSYRANFLNVLEYSTVQLPSGVYVCVHCLPMHTPISHYRKTI